MASTVAWWLFLGSPKYEASAVTLVRQRKKRKHVGCNCVAKQMQSLRFARPLRSAGSSCKSDGIGASTAGTSDDSISLDWLDIAENTTKAI